MAHPLRSNDCLALAGVIVLLSLLAGCATADDVGTVHFVESFPAETPLDLPDLEEASVVWPRVVEQTGHRFRVASFYYSRIGDGEGPAPRRALPTTWRPSWTAWPSPPGGAWRSGCWLTVNS